MILCVCRRLNTAKVNAAIDSGARTPACVLAHHGERFNCGRCRPAIAEAIEDRTAPACNETVCDAVPALMAAE